MIKKFSALVLGLTLLFSLGTMPVFARTAASEAPDYEVTMATGGQETPAPGGQETPAPLVQVDKVSLNITKITLNGGGKIALKATVAPAAAENKNVTWKSSNTKVAYVSKSGVVTTKKGIKKGNATITVTTKDGKKTAKCVVTIGTKVAKVGLDKTKATIKVGKSFIVKATVTPAEVKNKGITWKSSNPKIATVKNGKIVGKKPGKATITATTKDGGKTAKFVVTVKK